MCETLLQLEYEVIVEEAKRRWWGPCLAAVLSELETCKTFRGYLLAICDESDNGKGVKESLLDHCEARARIDLPWSIAIAVDCLVRASGTETKNILRILSRLSQEYFAWRPNSHLELLWSSALHAAAWQLADDQRVASSTWRQLWFFVNRIC